MRRIAGRSASFLFGALGSVHMNVYFRSDDELQDLVASFEACSFHPSEFRHYQYLAVALWYAWHLPYDAAAERITNGIRRLAETYGKTGYHETITLFWLRVVSNFLAKADRGVKFDTTRNQKSVIVS